jgi:hypothetical protein
MCACSSGGVPKSIKLHRQFPFRTLGENTQVGVIYTSVHTYGHVSCDMYFPEFRCAISEFVYAIVHILENDEESTLSNMVFIKKLNAIMKKIVDRMEELEKLLDAEECDLHVRQIPGLFCSNAQRKRQMFSSQQLSFRPMAGILPTPKIEFATKKVSKKQHEITKGELPHGKKPKAFKVAKE